MANIGITFGQVSNDYATWFIGDLYVDKDKKNYIIWVEQFGNACDILNSRALEAKKVSIINCCYDGYYIKIAIDDCIKFIEHYGNLISLESISVIKNNVFEQDF